ncbi:MAG: hypothetical protein HQK49_18470 [Oligoflexia bacterium]|nr:hypothetical protein [Oligoflexia bacterium]
MFSIRTKIIIISSFVLFIAIGVNTLILNHLFKKEYSDSLHSRGYIIVSTLKNELDRLLEFQISLENLIGFDEQCINIVKKYDNIAYAMILDHNDKILFHNDPTHKGKILLGTSEKSNAKKVNILKNLNTGGPIYSTTIINNIEFSDVMIPIFNNNKQYIGTAKIGFPSAIITQKTNKMFYFSLVTSVIFICFSCFLAFFFSNKITIPVIASINDLGESTEKIALMSNKSFIAGNKLKNSVSKEMNAITDTIKSLETIISIAEKNNESAKESYQISNDVNNYSLSCNNSMNELKSAIDAILISNDKINGLVELIKEIGAKIKIIEEIASKSKILSFNAAIESARAGIYGRGFTIVADEIKNLSSISSTASGHVSEIVEKSIKDAQIITQENKKKVEYSHYVVTQTIEILKNILNKSNSVLNNSQIILGNHHQQLKGILSIKDLMNIVSKISTQNSSLSDNSVIVGNEMKLQSQKIKLVADNLNTIVKGSIVKK